MVRSTPPWDHGDLCWLLFDPLDSLDPWEDRSCYCYWCWCLCWCLYLWKVVDGTLYIYFQSQLGLAQGEIWFFMKFLFKRWWDMRRYGYGYGNGNVWISFSFLSLEISDWVFFLKKKREGKGKGKRKSKGSKVVGWPTHFLFIFKRVIR